MRLVILISLVCSFNISAPAPTNASFNSDLSSLEERFFLHAYSSETAAQRLNRLDELVFGRVRQGSVQQRMTSLLLAVPNVQAQSAQPSPKKTQQATDALEPEQADMANSQPPHSDPAESTDYYPTVTALEEQIAGQTERSLPVEQRLARLETIAFGKPSTLNDLSERVNLLKQYVSKKNGGNDSYLSSSNAVGWTQGEAGLAAEVSSMEQEVFGKTYGRDDLTSRLTRLEKIVLPQQPVQTFTPIAFRVNRLMTALNSASAGPISSSRASSASGPAQSYYPSQNFAASSYMQQQQPQSAMTTAQNTNQPKHHPLLHKLGVVLGDVGGMAARSMMYGGYGYY